MSQGAGFKRLVLVGASSFIARHVATAARQAGIPVFPLPHNAALGTVLNCDDQVINFGLTPAYKRAAYDEQADLDLTVARQALTVGARFCLLSTRRVYGATERWGAAEDALATGDETNYGKNKSITEATLSRYGEGILRLRLSNVFGFEYVEGQPRGSFLGRLLFTLKQENRIIFDMHPDTRRDFIPADVCASAIVQACVRNRTGVLNLGSGHPLRCGDLADWIMQGYGQGRLEASNHPVQDEFYLDMSKWERDIGSRPAFDMKDYCISVGQRLRNA